MPSLQRRRIEFCVRVTGLERSVRGLYSLAWWALAPVYLLKLWWRGRAEPGYRTALRQRFGFGLPACEPGAVWVHAVSLGETLAAAALIDALRRECPGMRLLLTHGTATGRQAGQSLLRPGDIQTWLPVDSPGATQRFLARMRPSIGVLMETEVWPNLQAAARDAGVPMVLANARLSERSLRKGQRFSLLLGPAVAALKVALAQSEADAERLRAAGVQDVRVCGNLKYDLTPDSSQQALGQRWHHDAVSGRAVVALTNSRDGEEALLLSAWREVPQPRPLLLVVPRHPQRFDEVARLIEAQGWRVSRRSAWGGAGPDAHAGQADVWLGDSLGEMATYYSLADVALLGGSFMPLGGHNLIEAAANGCPLWMGPSTFNFADAARLSVSAGAAWQVADESAATQGAVQLLSDPVRLEQAVQCARRFAATHRGAADRMARAITALMPTNS